MKVVKVARQNFFRLLFFPRTEVEKVEKKRNFRQNDVESRKSRGSKFFSPNFFFPVRSRESRKKRNFHQNDVESRTGQFWVPGVSVMHFTTTILMQYRQIYTFLESSRGEYFEYSKIFWKFWKYRILEQNHGIFELVIILKNSIFNQFRSNWQIWTPLIENYPRYVFLKL